MPFAYSYRLRVTFAFANKSKFPLPITISPCHSIECFGSNFVLVFLFFY